MTTRCSPGCAAGRCCWTAGESCGTGSSRRSGAPTSADRIVQRAAVRIGRGPLAAAGKAAHEILARLLAAVLSLGAGGATAYVGGSLAYGRFVLGISDVDLVIVAGSERAATRVRDRWQRITRPLPGLRRLVHVAVATDDELTVAVSGTCRAWRGAPSRQSAIYFGPQPLRDEAGVTSTPTVGAPLAGWRRLHGAERLPLRAPWPEHERPIVAWLNLQATWRLAIAACLEPTRPYTGLVCVKLAADPARVWLWLSRGTVVADRVEALREAADARPDLLQAAERLIELERRLSELPEPPLAEALRALVTISAWIADEVDRRTFASGGTEVRLRSGDPVLPGSAPPAGAVPLADWRACVVPPFPDEALLPLAGEADDPEALAHAARRGRRGLQPAIQRGRLLILPATEPGTAGLLRAVQAPATDPVSFAALTGGESATFPAAAGWSAEELARRGIAEHRARLGDPQPDGAHQLIALIGAARVALLEGTLAEGSGELALTARGVLEQLAERLEADRAETAIAAGEAFVTARRDGIEPPASLVAELRESVLSMGAYRDLK
jgi:hypothetical protein